METLIRAILNGQNSILTSLGGVERSRFLLRAELVALAKTDRQNSFKRIFHVVTWDANVTKTHMEASLLSFKDLNLNLAKIYGTETEENKSDDSTTIQAAQLIICPMKYVLDVKAAEELGLSRLGGLIVFDGVPLDSIEGNCCEISAMNLGKTGGPDRAFGQLSRDSWSIVMSCNGPIDGIELELDCEFPIIVDRDLLKTRHRRSYRVFSSILKSGPNNVPMTFAGETKIAGIHDEVGRVVEECARRINSGVIVILLPSYGEMIEFHNHWHKSGLFERIGLPYARENRGPGQLKEMLVNLTRNDKKSIALISHRFHQDIHLADCVLSSCARVVISVGSPKNRVTLRWRRSKGVCEDSRPAAKSETLVYLANK